MTCSVAECNNIQAVPALRGFCGMHYTRYHRRQRMDGLKRCSDCGSEFPVRSRSKRCALCRKKYSLAWFRKWSLAKYHESDASKMRIKRENQKLKQYGLSRDGYASILAKQGGVCAICKKACSSGRKLAVDHNHHTGAVRGLLCVKCNNGLGNFGDSLDLLRFAI